MISVEAQKNLLLAAARRLKKQVTAYAIGGTAMMFLGFKESTKDIDLVFRDEKSRDLFKKAIEDIGYREMSPVRVYGVKKNAPVMLTLGDERFDLFLTDIIGFIFSEEIMERCEKIHQFHDNLIIRIANPHDIILMKCATDRVKDIDDAKRIIESGNVDWDLLIDETQNQVRLGRSTAAFELGEFLEKMKYKMHVDIPKKVLDKLFDIVKGQIKRKQR